MANTNAPFGFRPSRKIDGSVPNYQLVSRRIAYNYATKIAKGDLVTTLADGTIGIRAGGGSLPTLGVFWGCRYNDPTLGSIDVNSWVAPTLVSTTVVEALVYVDKNMIYQCRIGGSTGTLTQADVGANFDTGGDSTPIPTGSANGFSTAYLLTTGNTTATFPWKLWSLGNQIQGNSPLEAYAIVEVVPNFAELYYTTGLTT